VREPTAVLRSLARHWPDFTDDESRWDALGRAADAVEAAGQPLVVVDANQLCDDPAGVVAAWCEAMDLPFVESALTWEPGMREEWDLGGEWHATTAQATGFGDLDDPPEPPTGEQPRLLEAYQRAAPVYARLLSCAVRADSTTGK